MERLNQYFKDIFVPIYTESFQLPHELMLCGAKPPVVHEAIPHKMITPTPEMARSMGSFSGSGAFSEVYVLPGKLAVKVSAHACADSWLLWAAFASSALGKGSPLSPKVHGVRVDVSNNSYTALMEECVEIPYKSVSTAVAQLANGEADALVKQFTNAMHCNINAGFPGMQRDYAIEDYSHNFMRGVEDNRLVLTDPVCTTGWRDLKDFPDSDVLDYMLEACELINPGFLEVVR